MMGFMASKRAKFATQVNPRILATIRDLAHKEGRQLQSLIDEALSDLIEKHRNARPRSHVMALYLTSHDRYAQLYKKLAE